MSAYIDQNNIFTKWKQKQYKVLSQNIISIVSSVMMWNASHSSFQIQCITNMNMSEICFENFFQMIAQISIEMTGLENSTFGCSLIQRKQNVFYLYIHVYIFYLIVLNPMKCILFTKNKVAVIKKTVAVNHTGKFKEWCHGMFFSFNRYSNDKTDSRGPNLSLPALGRLNEHASKNNRLKLKPCGDWSCEHVHTHVNWSTECVL